MMMSSERSVLDTTPSIRGFVEVPLGGESKEGKANSCTPSTKKGKIVILGLLLLLAVGTIAVCVVVSKKKGQSSSVSTNSDYATSSSSMPQPTRTSPSAGTFLTQAPSLRPSTVATTTTPTSESSATFTSSANTEAPTAQLESTAPTSKPVASSNSPTNAPTGDFLTAATTTQQDKSATFPPTFSPTTQPSENLSASPTSVPTKDLSSAAPTMQPSAASQSSTLAPSPSPTRSPRDVALSPTPAPSVLPSSVSQLEQTADPIPTFSPTSAPTEVVDASLPTLAPTRIASLSPSVGPTLRPTTAAPTTQPTSLFDCYSESTSEKLGHALCGLYCDAMDASIRSLGDRTETQVILFADLDVETKNIKCWNTKLGDIETALDYWWSKGMVFRGDVNDLDWSCTMDYQWTYGLFRGEGTAEFQLDGTSATTKWQSNSEDFAEQAPNEVIMLSCDAEVAVTALRLSASAVEQVLGPLRGILRESIEAQVSDLVCEEMGTAGAASVLTSQHSCY